MCLDGSQQLAKAYESVGYGKFPPDLSYLQGHAKFISYAASKGMIFAIWLKQAKGMCLAHHNPHR